MAKTKEQKEADKLKKEEKRRAALSPEEREAEDAKNTAKEIAKGDKNVAVVTWRGNVREFSREIHGDGFKDLAEEFAETHDGEVM